MAPPPRKKKARQPAPTTTILDLGDALLREVFLRLPSLASLVRSALACPAFLRAVRSSPAFRRRFRDLHSPSLLGAFLVNDEPTMPTFTPVLLPRRRRGPKPDPDQAAALRGLDVSLTRLLDTPGDKEDEDAEDEEEEDVEDDEEDEWSMCGCRDGYVLLIKPRWNTKKVAVYDPLTRALHLFPGPPDELFSGESEYTESEFHVISSDADDRSFRILCVSKEKRGDTWRKEKKEIGESQVAVFSPDTREWQISPTTGNLQDTGTGTLVNGFVYWSSEDGDNLLNTATLQFSQIDLPPRRGSYGETNDGELCSVVGSDDGDLELDVWVRRAGDDGVYTWMHDMTYQMLDAIDKLPSVHLIAECPELNVVAIIGGIVYFSLHQDEQLQKDDPPSWLLSFCLETRELKKLCSVTSYEFCYPYIMAWPPSLVRNKEEN